MKKLFCVLLLAMMFCAFTACDSKDNSSSTDNSDSNTSESQVQQIDVDLTKLSSTVVYSDVYNMMYAPDSYIGKTVKMKGQFSYYEDSGTKKQYFACVIADAAACCSQGLEFTLTGEHTYPDDYPELGSEITVTGEFELYEENGSQYSRLVNATLVN